MTLNRQQLADALEKAKYGLSKDIPEGDLFVFKQGRIFSFSGQFLCSIPFDHEFDGTVRAQDIIQIIDKYNFIDEIKAEEIDGQLKIRAGKSRTSLRLYDDRAWAIISSILPAFEDGYTEVDPEMHNGFIQCLLPDKKSDFSGVYMDDEKYLATDLLVLSRYKSKLENRPKFWFDRTSVVALSKILEIPDIQWAISPDGMWVYWKTISGELYGARGLSIAHAPFDKIENVYEQTKESDIIATATMPENIKDVLDRLLIFGKSSNNEGIQIHFSSKRGVAMRTEGIGGEIIERLDAEVEWNVNETITGVLNFSAFSYCAAKAKTMTLVGSKGKEKDERRHNYKLLFEHDKWSGVCSFTPEEEE
jgi:hypothetical protein